MLRIKGGRGKFPRPLNENMPLRFLTRITGLAHGLCDFLMTPAFVILFTCLSTSFLCDVVIVIIMHLVGTEYRERFHLRVLAFGTLSRTNYRSLDYVIDKSNFVIVSFCHKYLDYTFVKQICLQKKYPMNVHV